ncbi:ABC transporter substrate-binding protein [Spirochaeta isovalerica]|uniref:Putative ABC transport system substrate-binding protein n=1 Tax=Spirochaeta isovalerica TaxID=150 RepID=A0A841RGX0_9SPIO|nr:ABC transporter substrate binding protein [Spirochaeta isovalerica]MBB6481758.1 putative ABC transport system substrate-binding protein [Spirochaeta isovalerica]
MILILFTGVESFSFSLLIIDSQAADPYIPVRDSLLAELERKGFSEGGILDISLWSLANQEGLAKRAWLTEKDKDYDLIFINGTVAAAQFSSFALNNFRYKFLFGAVTDPVSLNLIKDFSSHPYSNFTGVAYPVQVRERLRFIMAVLPEAKDIGFIYADMSQSRSYRKWLDEILIEEEFQSLNFHFRTVEFVQSEAGHIRMAMLSEKYIIELDPMVDIFLSPNDQMGVQPEYARTIRRLSGKPLIGLGEKDVMEEWGAVMSIFPDLEQMGVQLAGMAEKLLTGTQIGEIIPQWPETGVAFNLKEAERLGITIPEEYLRKAGDKVIR